MATIKIKDLSFKPYISEQELQQLIKNVAQKINHEYKGKSPLFLGVLNGSFMFMGDLMKSIDLECSVSFVKLASYEGTESKGTVNQLIGLNESLDGKDVIIVEDIVDTGNTLEKLYQIIEERNPKSLKIATLLYKPEAYKKDFNIDFVAKEIPNNFVVGYGLDYDGYGRNLSSIYVLNQ
ncbi:MAG: hypoxanthine phosphoribosyltransferase [Flavobacteriales bacterium]|nr:hypoxanthine phosphoribosyltransferase [Flavobacteriales bacterium]